MSDTRMQAELGANAARGGQFTATITLDVKVRRAFIWMMKLRAIWAIIRAKAGHERAH